MGKRIIYQNDKIVRLRKRIKRKPIQFDEIELDLSVFSLQNILIPSLYNT